MLVICSICGRNWGFSFRSVIIMKTVEKENYGRLWQSFTERLEEGKNVTQAYPASTKQGKEQNHSLLSTKKKEGKRKLRNCNNTYVPAASNPKVEANSSLVLLAPLTGWLRRSK